MAKIFDIDERAGGYEPVVIRFRGNEYKLGETVEQLLDAADVQAGMEEDESESAARRSVRLVEPWLRALCPLLGPVVDETPLSPTEKLALLAPLTEAANALGRFREDAE